MDLDQLARELNPPQLEAVTQTEGPLLVYAGAGSGKTRVITYRIAHILESRAVAPWRVLAVTFTNKAAGEMRERLGKLVGTGAARDLWIATFHATGAKLLRRYGERLGLRKDFAIYDDGDQRVVMRRVYEELKIDDRALKPAVVLGEIDRAKQEVLAPEDLANRAKTAFDLKVAQAYASYERRLAANNAVDFGDLLARVVKLLEGDAAVRAELQSRFQYLLVDEFQDTNAAQYRILRALTNERRNICVVGDDDQAIYRWRGADVRNIQFFKRDFPNARVVKLEQNYRSTRRILRAANAVISRSTTREPKVLFTQQGEGPVIEVLRCEDERDEARQIAVRVRAALARGTPAKEVAVFYRIHAQSRPIEEAMRAHDIPYAIVGGVRFYERAEVKDLLAYLRLMLNPNDDVSLLRVVNTPPRKIGKTTLDRLEAHAGAKQTTLWKLFASGDYPADVGPAARKSLAAFYKLVTDLRKRAAAMLEHPSELAEMVYTDTGYRALLDDPNDPDNEGRRENVAELVGSMIAYEKEEPEPSLTHYLERVSLSEETASAEGGERVSLMSVHSAKGLEFQTVFIAGLEDGMFPYKGMDLGADPDEMEEERRLAYVAITRARVQLGVCYVRFRQIFGQTRANPPSRFLEDIQKTAPDVLSARVARRSLGDGGADRALDVRAPRPSFGSLGPATRVVRDEHSQLAPESDTLTPTHNGTRFRKGMRVKHAKWGLGNVRTVEQGDELKLVVYFPGIGQEKKLLAEFVSPL